MACLARLLLAVTLLLGPGLGLGWDASNMPTSLPRFTCVWSKPAILE